MIFLACVILAAAPAAKASKSDAAFTKLSERYVDAMFALSPVAGSYVGYRKYDGTWPDYSEAGVKKALATLAAFDKELAAVKPKDLSKSLQMDYDLIKDDMAASRFAMTELQPYKWDPQLYNEAIGSGFYYLTYEPKAPGEWPARLDSILARMRTLPAYLKSAEANLQNAPKVHVEFVIGANPGNKETFTKQLPPLFEKHPKKKAEFDALAPRAIAAIDEFQTFLEKTLLPKATLDWRLGEDKWKKKLEHSLASSKAPEQIYKEAEEGLAKTRRKMFDLALPLYQKLYPNDKAYKQLIGDAKVNTVVGRVIAKASEKHGTPESLFSDVRRYAEKVTKFIKDKDLVSMPPADDNFVIEPTPPFLDGMAVAFFNPSPALEPWLKKSYWISSVPKTGTGDAKKDAEFAESFLREYNDYGLQTLTIHEAFPGHYVQLYWSQRSPYATLVKKVMESGTMAEGWAVMIEDIVYEQGYAKDEPENELMHLKMNLRTYINAMIDQKLHTSKDKEADLDEWALELMQKKGFQQEAEAKRKLRRAKLTSTQLSTYFVGYREMREIYDAAMQKAGAKSKAVLDQMLSYGTIPPRLIRELMLGSSAPGSNRP
jgi:uncharacterized protein (DUF885 family)